VHDDASRIGATSAHQLPGSVAEQNIGGLVRGILLVYAEPSLILVDEEIPVLGGDLPRVGRRSSGRHGNERNTGSIMTQEFLAAVVVLAVLCFAGLVVWLRDGLVLRIQGTLQRHRQPHSKGGETEQLELDAELRAQPPKDPG
jgi:hypothetical protein